MALSRAGSGEYGPGEVLTVTVGPTPHLTRQLRAPDLRHNNLQEWNRCNDRKNPPCTKIKKGRFHDRNWPLTCGGAKGI